MIHEFTDFSFFRTIIILDEFNNTVNDVNYIYSGLTLHLDYNDFTLHFNTTGYTYSDITLNNDVFTYTGFTNEIHYFYINGFNQFATNDQFTGLTNNQIISNFSKEIIPCVAKLDSTENCCPQPKPLSNKPWRYAINYGNEFNNCNEIYKRRPERGWTLHFVFNRENNDWNAGNIFFYMGTNGDGNPENYADNNLSFGFTEDGRIKWNSIHYNGVTPYYLTSGVTTPLCTDDPTKDWGIWIVFERYIEYYDCDLNNEGGYNNLILHPTLVNSELDIMTGATPIYSYPEILNPTWASDKSKRLGRLKIYLNGRPIYTVENWEEIVLSDRGVQPFIHSWGGGVSKMGNIHNFNCAFNIKHGEYIESPMSFLDVRDDFRYHQSLNIFDFQICGTNCTDSLTNL